MINTGIGRVKPAHEAMYVNGNCIIDAPLYVWLGPGGDWKYNGITKGVTLCPGDERAIEALPGDWIIKLPDGSLTIARGVEQKNTKIYNVSYEFNYEGSTTVLITDDFAQAKAIFREQFDDGIRADRIFLDTWENGKCVDSRDFQFEEEP